MKIQLLLLFLISITIQASAQDTIIKKKDFTLEIRRATASSKAYQSIKSDIDFQVTEFSWVNNRLSYIVEKWVEFMQLETIEYRIEGEFEAKQDYFARIDTAKLREALKRDSNVVMRDFLILKDSTDIFRGFDVKLTNHSKGKRKSKEIHREAFEIFAAVIGFELEVVVEEKTFWMLHIIDLPNATISPDQNTYWKRVEFENHIHYEVINFRRIADLVGRKLDDFVRPVPYDSYKFDINIPKSSNPVDLQYAMEEHGLELIQVTEMVEVLVIKAVKIKK